MGPVASRTDKLLRVFLTIVAIAHIIAVFILGPTRYYENHLFMSVFMYVAARMVTILLFKIIVPKPSTAKKILVFFSAIMLYGIIAPVVAGSFEGALAPLAFEASLAMGYLRNIKI